MVASVSGAKRSAPSGNWTRTSIGIGASELLIQRLAGGDRLLLVGHLVGEAVARIEVGVDERQADHGDEADERIKQRVAGDARRDPVAAAAERVDGEIALADALGETLFAPHEQDAEERHHQDDGEERDGGGNGAGGAEQADEARIGKEERGEGQAGGERGEHAGGTDDHDGAAHGLILRHAGEQAVAVGERQLHGIGEAHDEDQRRHDVQEHVQPEIQPAERAQRPQQADGRRGGGDQHERDAAEEEAGDEAAGDEADGVINDAIALDGVADLELHHRNAGKTPLDLGALKIEIDGLANLGNNIGEATALDDIGLQRQDNQRQRTILGEKLAADDVVVQRAIDQRLVGGVVIGKILREERLGDAAGFGRLARGEERDDAVGAIDQLKVGDEAAQGGEGIALQHITLDHDQDIVLGRGEALGHLLVLLELGRIRAKQLGERIVDLDAIEADDRGDREENSENGHRDGPAKREQADSFHAEGDADAARILAACCHGQITPASPPSGSCP